jgi:hypothetical protein
LLKIPWSNSWREFSASQPFPSHPHLTQARNGSNPLIRPNFAGKGRDMKALALAGVVVLILGIISFFVPMPHSEHHGVNVGDAHVGVTTEHDEKVPPALSVVLIVVGGGLIIAGRKE